MLTRYSQRQAKSHGSTSSNLRLCPRCGRAFERTEQLERHNIEASKDRYYYYHQSLGMIDIMYQTPRRRRMHAVTVELPLPGVTFSHDMSDTSAADTSPSNDVGHTAQVVAAGDDLAAAVPLSGLGVVFINHSSSSSSKRHKSNNIKLWNRTRNTEEDVPTPGCEV
ncbi:hypothetical protein GMORB2_7309 [Geosmithia morbida]|uniref:C2H2-type domain-containing protein n=1 Tax=Geosmithia morbida TaxID=1094350 RepID=A0A9P4YV07_9HYPO|nr:uncharacterized protein GMORB2_7309 [Geosmithia morbida]KAF4122317.1 hypothetical protein GMORB2_7309 [Geosmithia morbida]